MEEDIDQRIYSLVRRYNGVYFFNNEQKQRPLNPETDLDTDLKLDVGEAEELMEAFFTAFNVDKGNFRIETYFPDEPFSWALFKKLPPIPVPDFTIAMLIESAKVGRWLYN